MIREREPTAAEVLAMILVLAIVAGCAATFLSPCLWPAEETAECRE